MAKLVLSTGLSRQCNVGIAVYGYDYYVIERSVLRESGSGGATVIRGTVACLPLFSIHHGR